MTDALEAAVDELYARPPDGFIAARTAIVERLKVDGDAEAAAEVAKLRKPSVAAWAVDRLAREHPDDIGALIVAGQELASAQRKVSAGGDADAMRDAADERKRLVDRLVRAAAAALKAADMSAARATLDKVSDTLLAIATDEDAADRVRRGVLDKELPAPAGFGDERLDAALLASVTALPTRGPAADAPSGPTPAQVRAREHAERLAAAARELKDEADRSEREAKQAQVAADAAAKAATSARRKAEAARKRADEAAR
jgi:hypothetical protein